MTRAWAADPELEVDSVTRKGKNAEGQDTLLRAGRRPAARPRSRPAFRRAASSSTRTTRIVIANVEADFFTRAQLAMIADFVAERGGGLLVLGGRSFAQRGLSGTPLEEVLPVELNDRRGGARARVALDGRHAGPQQGDAHERRRNASDHADRRRRSARRASCGRRCRRSRRARRSAARVRARRCSR